MIAAKDSQHAHTHAPVHTCVASTHVLLIKQSVHEVGRLSDQ